MATYARAIRDLNGETQSQTSSWASISPSPPWPGTWSGTASRRPKPGKPPWKTTSGTWSRSTSSRFRRSDFRFCTCFWFWRTTAGAFSTSASQRITAEWTAQQVRKAFPWDSAPRYLLRDLDRIFGKEFVDQVKAQGITQVLSAPRSPWQRAYSQSFQGYRFGWNDCR